MAKSKALSDITNTANQKRGPNYSMSFKNRTIGNLKYASFRKVSKDTGVPERTLKKWKKTYREYGTFEPRPRNPNQNLLNERDLRRLNRIMRLHAHEKEETIIELFGKKMCRDTFRKYRKELGYERVKAKAVPSLSKLQIAKRYSFAKERAKWHKGYWKKYLFCDESSVSTSDQTRNHFVWKKKDEPFQTHHMVINEHSGRCSVMIWGGIYIDGRTKLFRLESSQNNGSNKVQSDDYLELIQNPELHIPSDTYWIQDNAPIHTARKVESKLRSQCHLVMFPPNSPDLNPIENIWAIMKKEYYENRQKNYKKRVMDVKNRCEKEKVLFEVLKEIWDGIDQEVINNCIYSMAERTKDCAKKKGYFTGK